MTVRKALLAPIALLGVSLIMVPTIGAQDEPDLSAPVVGVSTLVQPGEEPAVAFVDTTWPDEVGSCTGTLVHPEWVLSAAHCVLLQDGTHADTVSVLLGSVDLGDYFGSTGLPPGAEVFQSDGWVIHGNPHIGGNGLPGTNGEWYNDVVMIHLAGRSAITPMELTTDASLTEPASNAASDRLPARFYGFGLHNCPPDCGSGDLDGRLRRGDSTIYSDDFADNAGAGLSNKELNRNIFLFPNLAFEGGGCFGDSGGPMTVFDPASGTYKLVGVNSFIVSATDGWCDGLPLSNGDFLIHAAADLVGSGLGDWVRSIANASETCSGMTVQLTGSSGDDIIIGTGGVNIIDGRGGNDVIRARSGDDYICGGSGNDDIRAGKGADVSRGDKGADTIAGQSGPDVINGGAGNDDLSGGSGADRLLGKSGKDDIEGNGGGDVIEGGKGSDRLKGNAGADELDGGSGRDDAWGGKGADTIRGGTGADELFGNNGDDVLRGNGGDDALDGGKANDTCRGGPGTNTLANC